MVRSLRKKFYGHWNRLRDWIHDSSFCIRLHTASAPLPQSEACIRIRFDRDTSEAGCLKLKLKGNANGMGARGNKRPSAGAAVQLFCPSGGLGSRDGPVWKIRRFQGKANLRRNASTPRRKGSFWKDKKGTRPGGSEIYITRSRLTSAAGER